MNYANVDFPLQIVPTNPITDISIYIFQNINKYMIVTINDDE